MHMPPNKPMSTEYLLPCLKCTGELSKAIAVQVAALSLQQV